MLRELLMLNLPASAKDEYPLAVSLLSVNSEGNIVKLKK